MRGNFLLNLSIDCYNKNAILRTIIVSWVFLKRKYKPKRNKHCHLPENRVKNLSNPLVSSLIITCNLLSVCIVQLFLQLFLLTIFFFAPLYFFYVFFFGEEKKLNFCVYVYSISLKFSAQKNNNWMKSSTVFYIFLIFNYFTVFESSLRCYSANAVFLFLDSLKCVIIFTFFSLTLWVRFYCLKKI